MNKLKVVTVSLDIAWDDIEENLYIVGKSLQRVDKDTDIVILPELFTTGFIDSPDHLHKSAEESKNSSTLKKLSEWSAKFNFAICGSLLVRDGDKIYNRGFFVEPSGETTYYDKKHLFNLSSEKTHFQAGCEQIPVIRFRGWNIALAICYEVRFPAWLRNTGYKYDVLIVPANWPRSRGYAWKQLLIARAIENQAYVIGCNRSGQDDTSEYDNLTYCFDYLGKPVQQQTEEQAVSADDKIQAFVLDQDREIRYRKNFPVIADADNFKFI